MNASRSRRDDEVAVDRTVADGSTKLGVERRVRSTKPSPSRPTVTSLAVAHQPERKVVEQLVREHEVDRRPQLVGDLDPLDARRAPHERRR